MVVLSQDWYGLANALAILTSILVRVYILQANRHAIDAAVREEESRPMQKQTKENRDEHDKTLVILPNSKVVTVFLPRKTIKSVFIQNPSPSPSWLYTVIRWIGWAAFGVHVVSLGMTRLASQIYSIILLVLPTALVCSHVGCDDFRSAWLLSRNTDQQVSRPYTCWIGSYLEATVCEWPIDVEFKKDKHGSWQRRQPDEKAPSTSRRQDIYAWLNLSTEEEDSLARWDFLPHPRGHRRWSEDFNSKKKLIQEDPPNVADIVRKQRQVNIEITSAESSLSHDKERGQAV
ncbi:uncharacterized protein CDV56_102117 [Aspergillus thermomutatus]|uniref:Uncharacterized protein n=1 Tax=Aspergillus thermomutatus TaxID=41047 RepID=A0A397FXS3_ASPTH|nr:uncharacterized protein CDV56_102117 [Aspergillus thermomutatus]RHZ43465.1 hypothetical protein CDV56_102117 [Aspergillus thermomutatus]